MELKFSTFNTPILLISDNPCLYGGLSRMCRDLASLCATLPDFRVGVLGRGTGQRRKLPWITYDFPETGQWGEGFIEHAWNDLSGGQPGVIITLDDPSRRLWFANPVGLPENLQRFLGPGRNFRKWGYFPLDSTGPNGVTLPTEAVSTISGYDRALASSEWGYKMLLQSFPPHANIDWLPHGIIGSVFKIHPGGRTLWNDVEKTWGTTVGCVMANQSRKDFPAAFECFAVLKHHYGNDFKAWLHTDTPLRYWNVYALATDYGVTDCLTVTSNLSDESLSMLYSACDCTFLPSAGEGFGYPIAESMFCGTACVVTDYGGGAELVSEDCRVPPVAYRVDTQHNCRRAVLSGYAFAEKVKEQVQRKKDDWEYRAKEIAHSVEHLNWANLKHLWVNWMKAGLR